MHIQRHKQCHTQAHMYHQHTRGMATTRHRSLVERGGRKALLETLHTQKKKTIFTNLKKRFEHIELPSKLLDCFLRSKKSNINQTIGLDSGTPPSLPQNLSDRIRFAHALSNLADCRTVDEARVQRSTCWQRLAASTVSNSHGDVPQVVPKSACCELVV